MVRLLLCIVTSMHTTAEIALSYVIKLHDLLLVVPPADEGGTPLGPIATAVLQLGPPYQQFRSSTVGSDHEPCPSLPPSQTPGDDSHRVIRGRWDCAASAV